MEKYRQRVRSLQKPPTHPGKGNRNPNGWRRSRQKLALKKRAGQPEVRKKKKNGRKKQRRKTPEQREEKTKVKKSAWVRYQDKTSSKFVLPRPNTGEKAPKEGGRRPPEKKRKEGTYFERPRGGLSRRIVPRAPKKRNLGGGGKRTCVGRGARGKQKGRRFEPRISRTVAGQEAVTARKKKSQERKRQTEEKKGGELPLKDLRESQWCLPG